MKKCLLLLLVIILNLQVSFAQTYIQMPLPVQTSTLPGNVRGYYFTAPTCFTITGLEVPTDASTGAQSIAVVRLNAIPPNYSSSTNDFTLLYLTQSNSSTGMIPVSIQVGVGDIIGILGYRGANNSYATSPYSSTINGFPVTLARLGMQFSLDTTSPQDLWTEVGGSISRVWMYYDTSYVFTVDATWQGGTNYSFTNGAGPSATSVWDYGDGSPLDTAYNPLHTYAAPGNYTVCSYITGSCVSDTACTTVIICPAPALADYSTTINYPDVTFNDLSQNAAAWSWDFGDGATSTSQSPTHTYGTFGLYSVCLTVTDTCGGQHTECKNISVCPSVIPVSLGSDVTACGETTVSLPGYTTYTWSNNATTSSVSITNSGTYSVVVTDAAGCSGTDTIGVVINPLPSTSLGNDVTQCGGTVAIGPLVVDPTFTYVWSNGATTSSINVGAGSYALTVTDTLGCTDTDDIQITINPVPSLNLGNDLTVCQQFIGISAPNGVGYTYLWSNGSTLQSLLVNTSGTYSVVVTTSLGCTATDTIVISMFAPLVSYVETQTVACINNGNITLTPGFPSGGTYSGPGVSGTTFDPVVAGLGNKNIVYSWADSTGCTGRDTSVITVSTCAGLADINGTTIKAFPNPGDGMFRIESGVIADLMTVTDIAGREVLQLIPSATSTLIDLRKQETGVYTLLVRYRGEEAAMKLIIAR